MRSPSRFETLLATGLATASIGAFTGEASASTGGVRPETPAPTPASGGGGVSVVSPEQALAPQRHYVERHIQNGKRFGMLVLESRQKNAVVEVADTKHPGKGMSDPLVFEYGGRIAAYAARQGDSVTVIPAGEAEVTVEAGDRSTPVNDPETLVAPEILHATPNTYEGALGFADSDQTMFGQLQSY